MNNMNSEEQIFLHCMHEAAAAPQTFLEKVSRKETPAYWEEFWAYYAALRLHDEDYKERIYEKYVGETEEGNNFHLLLAYEKYLEYLDDPDYTPYLENGYDFLCLAEENLSPLLEEAFDALHSLLPVEEDVLPVEENFYTQELFVK